jgi:hypothetical protein
MPDSFLPPSGGPGSFDERDLDAVLSGETADIPIALGPVADTLAALRGAPTPAELGGEAAIMAEFRATLGRPAGTADTLVLPALRDGRPPRRAARHRARRRVVPSVNRRAGALMGVAAAVLIGVVLVSGMLPGPIGRLTKSGHTSSASPSASHSSGGNPLGTGTTPTKAPTTSAPTPTSSQVISSPPQSPAPSWTPSGLCLEYFGGHNYLHPDSPYSRESLYQQLAKLAGSPDFKRVFDYCVKQAGNMLRHEASGDGSQSQGNQGQDKPPASQSLKGGSARARQGAASSGNGNGNSGSSQANQGSGPAQNP